jgi:predicted HTH transcriptional regulator
MSRTTEESFDERQSHATLRDISETKVREFLHRSRNPKVNEPDARELYRSLRITVPVNGHDAPKNIALLFFSQYREKFFPGARIEVVQFGHDDSSTSCRADVAAMLERGLITVADLRQAFEEMKPKLIRFPSLEPEIIQKRIDSLEVKE